MTPALRVRRRFTGVIAVLLVSLCMAGCPFRFGRNYELDAKTFTAKSLAMVEQCSGITLPPGAAGANMYYHGDAIDPSFIAKIEIPAASREAVTEQLKNIPVKDIHLSGSMTTKVKWWNPDLSAQHIDRQFTRKNDYVHALLAQEADRLYLYVEWVSM